MPELPEVEIAARRLTRAAAGSTVESAMAPGMVTMKSFEPPLDALTGATLQAVRRRGKLFLADFGDLTLMVHLMSAGRLQLWDSRASMRDRLSRLLVRLDGGRELRLREFGTRQRAWAKLLPSEAVEDEETMTTLGPDAWPAIEPDRFAELIDQPRHLHPLLRDQRTVAGIGRSWVDEILWTARLSPFRKGSELEPEEVDAVRTAAAERMDAALDHYEEVVGDTIPDKLPMPLQVHRRAGRAVPPLRHQDRGDPLQGLRALLLPARSRRAAAC